MTIRNEWAIEATRAGAGPLEQLTAIVSAYYQRHIQRRDLAELLERDDHLIADMGLTRAEILREIAKPLWVM